MAAHHHDVREYTIGWLCALPVELAASRLVLDRVHTGLWLDPTDGMQYTLGNIGNHNIVIGCLPVGDKGIGAAATVATRMKDKFPNMQFGLMVGIGGGVPTKVDVRLGDVVVSQPVETSSSVVQYDMGQSTPDGFIRTGFLNAPPPILRQALANLQARHMCDDNKIPKYLATIEEKIKFKKPPPESDILFESTYDHAQPGESCDSCDKSKIKPRKPRIINDVVVHYGTIASGSRVIKNARERDLLSNEPGRVLCFEMEAAGLMNNFPCLVIRGISDYADSHKNDEWQPYAAAAAAAFAKDLLVDIPAIALPRIAAISIWIEESFRSTQEDFAAILREAGLENFARCQSIDDIYNVADEIQRLQAPNEKLFALKRIEPYIERVHEFVEAVETLTGIRKETVLIIWDTFKLVLQLFSSMEHAFNSIIRVISDIGRALPKFKSQMTLFEKNDDTRDILGLFYQEILDLQLTILSTYKKKNTELVFHSVWSKAEEKIEFFKRNIDRYNAWMNEDITTDQTTLHYNVRKTMYREMQEDDKAQVYANYQNVLSYFSPRFYEVELDKFQRKSAPNSGTWLHENDEFKRWLDPDDLRMRTLWLQGIPGAGKTILTAKSISRMRQGEAQVLFAFLAYDDKVQNHAVKVLQSLMFQFINRHPGLWSILHERFILNLSQLSGSLSYVEDLFTDLLRDSGPTFIALDGVDEIDEIERKDLLSSLTRLSESCKNLKLLVSSRVETDIAVLLKKRAVSIRVDHSNAGDIESYIDTRYDLWLPHLSRLADHTECSEIKRAFERLKGKANGMFLYVYLVLDIVTSRDLVPDIQEEIANLPNGLGQAYDRILHRIKSNLIISDRLAALTILQWIGCAARPLREQELLQVLAVQQHGSDDFSKGRKALRDIQRTCGPFIEIKNGTARFVHFTAKEYLFGAQSNNFIRATGTHWSIALTCINYLSFATFDDIFSLNINEAAIRQKILAGDFILFQYAATQWIHHVTHCAKFVESQYLNALYSNVARLYWLRKNDKSISAEFRRSAAVDFVSLGTLPGIQTFLGRVQDFQDRLEKGLLHTNDSDWKDRDPTMISVALTQLRKQLEVLLCGSQGHNSTCVCPRIHDLYGNNLYQCDRPFCQYYRIGFETRIERDSHLKVHSRPYQCPDRECIFAELGFKSPSELARHRSEAHPPPRCTKHEVLSEALVPQLSEMDKIKLVTDAVRHDDDVVSYLFQKIDYPRGGYDELQELAARYASSRMVKCIRNQAEKIDLRLDIEDAVLAAIRGENVVTLRTVITEAEQTMLQGNKSAEKRAQISTSRIRLGFNVGNADIMDILIDYGKVEFPSKCPKDLLRELIMSKMNEIEKARRLQSMRRYVRWPEAFTNAVYWAGVAGSTIMLQVCLDSGGSADATITTGRRHQSVRPILYDCVRRGSNRHAEVVKLLLQHGANPNARQGITMLSGIKKIENYFQMTWDELVNTSQGHLHQQ